MQTLVDLVKLGAIGASLAFLLLAYQLLASEIARKDGQPRENVLNEIRRFRASALIFLIVGVLSEILLSHGTEIIGGLNQLLFSRELVRVRFDQWEYTPDDQLVGFGFEENRVNTGAYILPALKDQYDVYVGIRHMNTTPYDQGAYKLLFGPYRLANQPRLNHRLTSDELAALGDDCVEFTAFAIAKADGKTVEIAAPVNISKLQPNIFNTASVCLSKNGSQRK